MSIHFPSPRKSPQRRQKGFALVIVLSCLLFITALIVSFLISMRTEVASSKASADSAQVNQLADTAVNIVISQIREATLAAGTNKLAWASQPGMIRLYNNQGNAAGFRKLYTWDNMVGDGAFNPSGNGEPVPVDWSSSPAVFTDLNSPIENGTEQVFPIFDYPAADKMKVTGVSLVGAVPGSTGKQLAPMPVKWLYVLADGSVSIATGTGERGQVVTGASANNPIVGRIAFWTDDETCKININTASEGTFWSTPRFDTADERLLAYRQPTRGEYQGYPGHPATVSLKTVFPSLSSEEIFDLAPRLSFGGSEGGTKEVIDVSKWITADSDRLYASVDEMLFKVPTSGGASRSVQAGLKPSEVKATKFFLTAHSRAPELNLFGLPRILTWPLHRIDNDPNYRTAADRLLAFCSTIGGKPFYFIREKSMRVSYDLEDSKMSRNLDLLGYLDGLTGKNVPGFGNSFHNKYSQNEMRQILTEIFDYIRCTNLYDATTPATAADKWPYTFASGTCDPGKLDHGRNSGLGQAAPIKHPTWKTWGYGGRFLQPWEVQLHFVAMGEGKDPSDSSSQGIAVPPEQAANSTKVVLGAGQNWNGDVPPDDTRAIQAFIYFTFLTPSEGFEHWSPGQWIRVEGLDGLKVVTDTSGGGDLETPLGFPGTSDPRGVDMPIMGNMLGGGGVGGGRVHRLEMKGVLTAQNAGKVFKINDPQSLSAKDERRAYPFYSALVPIKIKKVTNAGGESVLKFSGGRITIKIYSDIENNPNSQLNRKKGDEVNSFEVYFDPFVAKMPTIGEMRRMGTGIVPANSKSPVKADDDRWMVHPDINGAYLIDTSNDIMRSMSIGHGDVRLLQGAGTSTTFFKPTEGYNDFNTRISHSNPGRANVTMGNALHGKRGSLVKAANIKVNDDSVNFVPAGVNGVEDLTNGRFLGDWDNATAVVGDGPFINAADPGALYSINQATGVIDRPYFHNANISSSRMSSFFSPNRQIPSPVMFGSLPTGAQRGYPWQTLLFRPGPPKHPGSSGPKDHLLLDLFWMPIVEPYAISEPFSTAGKINMNQQLVPFTYIRRFTGLEAAFAAEKVAMVPKNSSTTYKWNAGGGIDSRRDLNMSITDGTLRQFAKKFADGEIFRSASEICDIFLVPANIQWSSDDAAQSAWYGDAFAMVGDNSRERPYAHLYNKLTTKSNTYTVHYRVQTLRIPKSFQESNPGVFDPAQGCAVVADRRGSTTIERYLDPNDQRFLADGDAKNFLQNPQNYTDFSLEPYYRFHVLQSSVFTP